MKQSELLNLIDRTLLENLYGFCYRRTSDHYESDELCSDILHAYVTAVSRGGAITDPAAFLWKIAHNVYADFSDKRRKKTDMTWTGDAEELFLAMADEEEDPDKQEEQQDDEEETENPAEEDEEEDDEIVYTADRRNDLVVGSTEEVLEAGFVIDEDSPEDIMDVFGDEDDSDADYYED